MPHVLSSPDGTFTETVDGISDALLCGFARRFRGEYPVVEVHDGADNISAYWVDGHKKITDVTRRYIRDARQMYVSLNAFRAAHPALELIYIERKLGFRFDRMETPEVSEGDRRGLRFCSLFMADKIGSRMPARTSGSLYFDNKRDRLCLHIDNDDALRVVHGNLFMDVFCQIDREARLQKDIPDATIASAPAPLMPSADEAIRRVVADAVDAIEQARDVVFAKVQEAISPFAFTLERDPDNTMRAFLSASS